MDSLQLNECTLSTFFMKSAVSLCDFWLTTAGLLDYLDLKLSDLCMYIMYIRFIIDWSVPNVSLKYRKLVLDM